MTSISRLSAYVLSGHMAGTAAAEAVLGHQVGYSRVAVLSMGYSDTSRALGESAAAAAMAGNMCPGPATTGHNTRMARAVDPDLLLQRCCLHSDSG